MIKSRFGFYVGDISNVLIDYCYRMFTDGNYGDMDDDGVGEVEVNTADMGPHPKTDCNVFGVVCDIEEGIHEDQYNNEYNIKNYNIGVVPLELCDKYKLNNNTQDGKFFSESGTATIEKRGNMVIITINDDKLYIDAQSVDNDKDDYDDDYDEYDDFDEDNIDVDEDEDVIEEDIELYEDDFLDEDNIDIDVDEDYDDEFDNYDNKSLIDKNYNDEENIILEDDIPDMSSEECPNCGNRRSIVTDEIESTHDYRIYECYCPRCKNTWVEEEEY